jgi:hypothetical protein
MKLFNKCINNHQSLILFILILVHLILLFSTKFTAWPEMLTYPWLVSRGFTLYQDIINPYFPGLTWVLTIVYSLLGNNILSLQLLTWLMIILCDLLIWKIVIKRSSFTAAVLSLSMFVCLSLIFEVNGLWFDLASLPLILFTYYLVINRKNLILTGLTIGIAIAIKQTNLIFIVPIVLAVRFDIKKVIPLLLGILAPIIGIFIYFIVNNNFAAFWYWSVINAFFIQAKVSGFALYPSLRQIIVLFIVFSPVLLLIITRFKNTKLKNILVKHINHPLWWWLCSFVFGFPRFGWFHMIIAVAFGSIMVSSIIFYKKLKLYMLPYAIAIFILLFNYLYKEFGLPDRFFEPSVLSARLEINDAINKEKETYFYNVSSEYFVESGIQPIKPWADNFPWYMETSDIQQRIISSIEEKKLKYIVYNPFSSDGKYDLGSYRPLLLDNYIRNNYHEEKQFISSLQLLTRN